MLRKDLRTNTQSRPFSVTLGGVGEADGAARVSQGSTLAITTVTGPAQPRYSRHEEYDKCKVEVTVNFASKQSDSARSFCNESRIVKFIQQVLESCIILENFPRLLIHLNILIVRNEGAALSTALNSCTLALLDAGIPMKAYASCVEVAMLEGGFAVDPTLEEENDSDGHFLAAFSSLKDENGDLKLISMENIGVMRDFTAVLENASNYATKLSSTIRAAISSKSLT